MDTRWRIELLGRLRARYGGGEIARFPRPKAGELLAYLAYYPRRSHSREALIEVLWPEIDPELGPDSFESWVLPEREALRGQYLDALHQLVAALEAAGDLMGALQGARQAVAADPRREEAHYDLMRLYAATGQPAACLRQYQELERPLREELDGTPSA